MKEIFKFNFLNKKGKQEVQQLSNIFDKALLEIEDLVEDSNSEAFIYFNRVFKQKLEEAYFYAKKAISIKKENNIAEE